MFLFVVPGFHILSYRLYNNKIIIRKVIFTPINESYIMKFYRQTIHYLIGIILKLFVRSANRHIKYQIQVSQS